MTPLLAQVRHVRFFQLQRWLICPWTTGLDQRVPHILTLSMAKDQIGMGGKGRGETKLPLPTQEIHLYNFLHESGDVLRALEPETSTPQLGQPGYYQQDKLQQWSTYQLIAVLDAWPRVWTETHQPHSVQGKRWLVLADLGWMQTSELG